MSKLFFMLLLLVCVSLLPASINASESARVSGAVVDPSGAKVIGARVALRDSAGLIVYETRTDADGNFIFGTVSPGRYTLIVEATGFNLKERTEVEITRSDVESGARKTVDVRLEIAALSDRVVVSATRTGTISGEIGGSVSVVSGQRLRRKNPPLLSESLRVVPGVAVAQTGGRGGITSIFVRGGKSDYTKVLIDGVPVNAPGGLFDYGSLTTENLDRVEVVRGPQSALFGSDAVTGVVQLFTRRGSAPTPEFEFSAEGGSYDFHREVFELSGLAGRFDYSGSFGYQKTGGRFRNGDYLNRSASTSLGLRVSERADLRLTSRLNNNTRGVPGPTAILFADPDQRLKHHDVAAGATLDWRPFQRWHQTARLVYSEFETHSFDPVAQDLTSPDTPTADPGPFNSDFAFSFRDHQKRAGFQYQSVAAIGASSVITAGVDYEHESAVFTDDFSRVSPARHNVGVYVQDQTSVRERLFVTAGVRVERNSGRVPEDLRTVLSQLGSASPSGEAGFGVAANPKLSLALVVRRDEEGARLGGTLLRASFGTGIKEARLDEAFSPSPFFVGNPALEPERAIGYDAGVSQSFFNRRASVEATYFDNRFRDIIIFTFDPATFGPVRLDDGRLTHLINLERASARGLELTGAVRPARQLHVEASYTFLRSELERAAQAISAEVGLPLIRRPRHSGSIQVSWAAERFDAALDGSFVGERRECDPIFCAKFDASGKPLSVAGYTKLDTAGAYHINKNVDAFARVENLLNADYQEVLGYPAYKANLSAGLRVRFGGGR